MEGAASCLPRCGLNMTMNGRIQVQNTTIILAGNRCYAVLWCWQVGYEEIESGLQSPSASLINALSAPMSQYLDEQKV